MKDMSERNRAADQIRLQAQLIDQAQTAVIATDLAGIVTVWNRGAEQLFGWTRAEALGANIRNLTMNADTEHGDAVLARLLQGEAWEGEYLAQRKDGTKVAISVSDAPIHDARGEFVGVVGVSTDISARKRAEQRLAAQYELTRVLAEATDLVPAAGEIMRVLGAGFGWDLGLAWIVDDTGARLRLLTTWSRAAFDAGELVHASAHATLTRGVGLPGHVWDAGEPLWVANVANDPRLVRGREAAASGLRSAL
jgi:PAS domain S-box-containing protein